MQKGNATVGWMTAVLGSMTIAIKAQTSLSHAAIRCNIVKTESATTGRGCIYGIEFPSSHLGNVRIILRNAHINVRHYLTERGDIL